MNVQQYLIEDNMDIKPNDLDTHSLDDDEMTAVQPLSLKPHSQSWYDPGPPPGYHLVTTKPPPNYLYPHGYPSSEPSTLRQAQPVQQCVTVVQPVPAQPLERPPPDYLVYSILTLILCCWPLGIVAVIKSTEARSANRVGNRQEAEHKSAQALKYNIIGGVTGSIIIIMLVIYNFMIYVNQQPSY